MACCPGEHDECMICLCPLLEADSDDEDLYIDADIPEVGAVWPCGHCFHLDCWNRYKKEKCPICQQHASLFSKIFISAPPPKPPVVVPTGPLNDEERVELERYRRLAREEGIEQNKMLLRDMERQVENDPQAAKAMMTMMVMYQARDMRKAERALEESQEECDYTKDILRVVQTELDESNKELSDLKPKADQLQKEVDRLKKVEVASRRHEKDKKQIALLQEKLERAKDKLALKNKQLSRRNKELSAKRKIIQSQKGVMAAKGVQHEKTCRKKEETLKSTKKELERIIQSQHRVMAVKSPQQEKACRKTEEALRSTRKELELLKELDSFTMEDSSNSLRLSLIWD